MRVTGEYSSHCGLISCDTVAVSGQAWHDHQWGDFSMSQFAGWDWFSVQFDNNTELMLYLIRQPDGSYTTQAGSFITAQGKTIELRDSDFKIQANGKTWQSDLTGAIYPLEWQISVPAYEIDIFVQPVLDNQEMNTRASTGIVYWEGAAKISGSHGGVGYIELTNYDLYPFGKTDKTTPLQPLFGPLGF
jgi:predicted secreted hydrolase